MHFKVSSTNFVITIFAVHNFIFAMKDLNYVELNTIHITSPRLMSLPPKEIEIENEKRYREKLKTEGKEEFIVCCNTTRDFLIGAIKLNITRRELDILKNVLNKHPYDRFGERNKFYNKTTNEIDIKALVEKIFEISLYFASKAITNYFLDEFYKLIQKENESSLWALTLAEFNIKWEKKYSEYSSSESPIQTSKEFFSVKDLKMQIAKGNVENVFEVLISNSDKIKNMDFVNSLINLSRFYSEIELERIKGIVTENDFNVRKNKTIDSLLKLIDQLE